MTPTAIAVIVLCAVTMYLAATVQQYVFDRRREARNFQKVIEAIAAPKSVIMMPSEPEVRQLVDTIHETAEQAKAASGEAASGGKLF
jgi:hypothetical protein